MTELLARAIVEIGKLPAEEQDAIATRILAELADERKWMARFDATTDEQWDRLAELARKEINSGETEPLEDILTESGGNE